MVIESNTSNVRIHPPAWVPKSFCWVHKSKSSNRTSRGFVANVPSLEALSQQYDVFRFWFKFFVSAAAVIMTLSLCPQISRADTPDFSKDEYHQVSEDIYTYSFDEEGGLRQGFPLVVPPVRNNGMIQLTYNFSWDDYAFGVNAEKPLLSNEVVGKDNYHLHLIKPEEEWPETINVPSSSSNYDIGNLPWSTDPTQKTDYMMARKDTEEFDEQQWGIHQTVRS